MKSGVLRNCTVAALAVLIAFGKMTASAQLALPPLGTQGAPPIQGAATPVAPVAPTKGVGEPKPLTWDSMDKTNSPRAEDPMAEFVFVATNDSDATVIILGAAGSCGCTVPKLPANPWVLGPHEGGPMSVSVNLAATGRMGSFYKTVTVIPSNQPPQVLKVTVSLPDSPEMARAKNQMAAMSDRQAVLKGDCARCHVEPAKGKMGKELYVTACGICHDALQRATMVPNLRALNHPTDYNYWKQWTSDGKPGTLMPAFAEKQGGPLTDEQIESLSQTLTAMFPSGVFVAPAAATNTNAIPPIPVLPAGGLQVK